MDCGSTLYSHRNNGLMTRSLEKLLEDAHLCGELKLGGRKLKEFPITNKYDLSDTTIAGINLVDNDIMMLNTSNVIFVVSLY